MSGQTPVSKTHPPAKRVLVYDQRRHAAELRRAGHTWDEVAALADYPSKSHACMAVKRLMQESRDLAYEEIALYRAESIERIEAVIRNAWPLMEAGSEKHMAIILRAVRQLGELRGENAPVKVQIGESDVDRLLREALEEHRRRAEQLDRQAGAVPDPADTDS